MNATPPEGMINNPAYAEWLFAHFDETGTQGPEPEKFIPDPSAKVEPKPAVIKTPPATTAERCAKYHARSFTCSCPDRQRGGSYADNRLHDMCCKHMWAIRTGQVDLCDVKAIERGMTREEYLESVGNAIAKTWPTKPQPQAPAKPVIDWFAFLEIA